MAAPAPDDHEQTRKKRTVWLLAGGAVCLLLPLMGVIYLKWSEASSVRGPSGRNDLFERREGSERKITPSQTAVPSNISAPSSARRATGRAESPAGSSLDFIKMTDDMKAKAPEPPKAETPAAPAPTPPPAPAVKAKTTPKQTKKNFSAPKLQPTRGFSGFKGGNGPQTAPVGQEGGQDMQELLKNLPPGAENNPEVQKYLKSQGR
ncbi:MAG TPA: hypothetical protein DCZ01_10500 [Elusimicrobia bacterium]|nr:MAG: hypothetical protein A2X37_00960 [Elusimicrobia bacterium GWA2_66_18]OGR70481.1 MAG: hypothetical protein A2X40_09400 [Elusimicrobia bacterium GWC2_65_9]HAZ08928.1 hypothetical protein [Elusimicrobiota bacterium]